MSNWRSSFNNVSVLVWICLHFLGIAYLLSTPLRLETDILSLVAETSDIQIKGFDNDLELTKSILKKEATRVDFLIHANSYETVLELEKSLLESISNYEELSPIRDKDDIPSRDFIEKIALERDSFLTYKQIQELNNIDPEKLVSRIQQKLNSTFGYLYIKFLPHDPMLLLADRFLEVIKQIESKPYSEIKQQPWKLLSYEVDRKASNQTLELIAENLGSEIESLNKTHNHGTISWSSFLRFQSNSAKTIKSEIQLLCFIASALTLIIVTFTFQSFYPVILSTLSILSGFTIATVLTHLRFGEIHLLTLGFGSSLMGACVDYSIHYISEYYYKSSENRISKVDFRPHIKPIAIGAFTSVVSFIFLYLGNFAGLSELAFFSVTGLIASFLTVLLLFPLLLRRSTGVGHPLTAKCADYFFKLPRLISCNKLAKFTLYPLYLFFLYYACVNFTLNDDIRLLQTPAPHLVEEQKLIEMVSGKKIPRAYFLTSGNSLKDALNNSAVLRESLESSKSLDPSLEYIAYTHFHPAPEDQRLSKVAYSDFLRRNYDKLKKAFQNEGFSEKLVNKIKPDDLADSESDSESESDLENKQSESRMLNQLLLNSQNRHYVITPVFNFTDDRLIQDVHIASPGSVYIEIRREIENSFIKFRENSILMTTLAYLLILLSLILLYGLKSGTFLFLPSVLTAITTMACLGLFNIPINFFSILALILVLGLCVDYSVFYKEQQSEATRVAVFLSTLTSISTFGILAFSSTPVLQSFGIVISIGVLWSQFFSALLFSQKS